MVGLSDIEGLSMDRVAPKERRVSEAPENDPEAKKLREKGDQEWQERGDFDTAWAFYTSAICANRGLDAKPLERRAEIACQYYVDQETGHLKESSPKAIQALYDCYHSAELSIRLDSRYLPTFIWCSQAALAIYKLDRALDIASTGIYATIFSAPFQSFNETYHFIKKPLEEIEELFNQSGKVLKAYPHVSPVLEKMYSDTQEWETEDTDTKETVVALLKVLRQALSDYYNLINKRKKKEQSLKKSQPMVPKNLCEEWAKMCTQSVVVPAEKPIEIRERFELVEKNSTSSGYFAYIPSSITLSYGEKGDGIFFKAAKDLPIGQVIHIDTPFLSVTTYPAMLCDFCMRSFDTVESTSPCPICRYTRYCSKQCRVRAWKTYHRVLCGRHHGTNVLVENASKNGYTISSRFPILAFKMFGYIAQQNLTSLLKPKEDLLISDVPVNAYSETVDNYSRIRDFGDVTRDWLRTVPTLASYARDRLSETANLEESQLNTSAFQSTYEALKDALKSYDTSMHLVDTDYDEPPLTKEEAHILTDQFTGNPLFGFRPLLQVYAIIMQNGMSIGPASCLPKTKGSEHHTLALPRAGAFFNHSCDANVDARAKPERGSRFIFTTERFIRKGEPLTISYVDADLPKQDRLEQLKGRYGFECACPRCNKSNK